MARTLLFLVAVVLFLGPIDGASYVFRTSTAASLQISYSTSASLWSDTTAWTLPNGTSLGSLPGPSDDVYINDVTSTCSYGLVFLDFPTTVRSLTVGSASCPTLACNFALVLNAQLNVIKNTIINPGSELRLGPNSLLNSTNVVVQSSGFIGGNGAIRAGTARINGTLNPYNESLSQISEVQTNALYYATITFTGSVIIYGTIRVDLFDQGNDKIVVNGDLSLIDASLVMNSQSSTTREFQVLIADPRLVSGSFANKSFAETGLWVTHNVDYNCVDDSIKGFGKGVNPNGSNQQCARSSKRCDPNSRPQPPSVCSSSNNGLSVLISPSQTCPPCALGYSGDSCDQATCTQAYPDCSGAGTCVGNYPDAPQCVCNTLYNGSSCQYPYCPGNGNCNNRGECLAAADGSSPSCKCKSNWTGIDCSIPLCPNSCSGHGTCSAAVDPPACVCQSGYTLKPDCSVKYIACPGTPACGGPSHGVCTNSTGQCACARGWNGTSDCSVANCYQDCGAGTCTTLSNGTNACTCSSLSKWNYQCTNPTTAAPTSPTSAPTVTTKPTFTSTPSSISTTLPSTRPPPSTSSVTPTPTPTKGATTTPTTAPAPITSTNTPPPVVSTSRPSSITTPSIVSTPAPSTAPSMAVPSTAAPSIAATTAVPSTAAPSADAPTTPSNLPTSTLTAPASTPTSTPSSGSEHPDTVRPSLTCVHGLYNSTATACECWKGWTGENCTALSANACPNNCSSNGVCTVMNGAAICACDPYFLGSDCSQVNRPCSSSCNSGECDTSTGTCVCKPNFSGPTCNIQSCPGCSKNGVCNSSLVCVCLKGWKGEDCTQAVPYCPNNCSNNGVCALEHSVNMVICQCNTIWSGADCSNSTLKTSSLRPTTTTSSILRSPVFYAPLCAGVLVIVAITVALFIRAKSRRNTLQTNLGRLKGSTMSSSP